MVLFAGMLTALLLFLMNPRIGDWYLLVLTLAAGAALALRELRTADPFIDLRVLAGNLPLLATYVRNLLSYIVSYAFLYGYTQWLEGSRGLSASQSGLILLGVFGTALIVSSTTGRRKEIRGKLVVGSIAQVVMCLLLLPLHATAAIWLLVLVAAVAGIPSGPQQPGEPERRLLSGRPGPDGIVGRPAADFHVRRRDDRVRRERGLLRPRSQ